MNCEPVISKTHRGEAANHHRQAEAGDFLGLPQTEQSKGVRVGRSRVGRGVFARKRYRAVAVVGEIHGELIDDATYGSSYCMDMEDGRVLEPHAPFRYVNHSCDPNCEFEFFDLASDGDPTPRRRIFLITLREIKPGEELTISYNWGVDAAIICRCGEPTCCGWIVAPEQLQTIIERERN